MRDTAVDTYLEAPSKHSWHLPSHLLDTRPSDTPRRGSIHINKSSGCQNIHYIGSSLVKFRYTRVKISNGSSIHWLNLDPVRSHPLHQAIWIVKTDLIKNNYQKLFLTIYDWGRSLSLMIYLAWSWADLSKILVMLLQCLSDNYLFFYVFFKDPMDLILVLTTADGVCPSLSEVTAVRSPPSLKWQPPEGGGRPGAVSQRYFPVELLKCCACNNFIVMHQNIMKLCICNNSIAVGACAKFHGYMIIIC